jgi:hypothetical protein
MGVNINFEHGQRLRELEQIAAQKYRKSLKTSMIIARRSKPWTVFYLDCLFGLLSYFLGIFWALPFPSLRSGFGSGASGLPAPPLLRCGRVCALTRAPYRPLARNVIK